MNMDDYLFIKNIIYLIKKKKANILDFLLRFKIFIDLDDTYRTIEDLNYFVIINKPFKNIREFR